MKDKILLVKKVGTEYSTEYSEEFLKAIESALILGFSNTSAVIYHFYLRTKTKSEQEYRTDVLYGRTVFNYLNVDGVYKGKNYSYTPYDFLNEDSTNLIASVFSAYIPIYKIEINKSYIIGDVTEIDLSSSTTRLIKIKEAKEYLIHLGFIEPDD